MLYIPHMKQYFWISPVTWRFKTGYHRVVINTLTLLSSILTIVVDIRAWRTIADHLIRSLLRIILTKHRNDRSKHNAFRYSVLSFSLYLQILWSTSAICLSSHKHSIISQIQYRWHSILYDSNKFTLYTGSQMKWNTACI